MKILTISPYPTHVKGGVSSYIRLLTESAKDFSVDNHVVSISRGRKHIERIISTNEYGVISGHSDWKTFFMANYFGWKHDIPSMNFLHSDFPTPLYGLKKKAYERVLNGSTLLVFPSRYLRKKNTQTYNINTKTAVLYPGTKQDTSTKKYSDRRYIGYLTPFAYKEKIRGVTDLYKIYPQLERQNIHIRIGGDGKYLEKVKERCRARNILFQGEVDEALSFLSMLDCYVHPSYLEGGVSISILEAISKGKPVVAYRTGGIPELLDEVPSSRLVPKGNLSSFLEAILEICEKPTATALPKRFTQEEMGKRLLRLLGGL